MSDRDWAGVAAPQFIPANQSRHFRFKPFTAAAAILDRFLHHAEIITITGRSYRLRGKSQDDSLDSFPTTEKTTESAKTAISPTGCPDKKATKSEGDEIKNIPDEAAATCQS